MWTCPKCKELIPDSKDSCSFCKTAKPKQAPNYCLDSTCPAYKVALSDERKVCRECGGITLIGKQIQDLS